MIQQNIFLNTKKWISHVCNAGYSFSNFSSLQPEKPKIVGMWFGTVQVCATVSVFEQRTLSLPSDSVAITCRRVNYRYIQFPTLMRVERCHCSTFQQEWLTECFVKAHENETKTAVPSCHGT